MLEYTLAQLNPFGTPVFGRAFEKRALSSHNPVAERNATPALREYREESPQCLSRRNTRCQTLRSHVRSAALRSCLRNANKSIIGNVI